MDTALTVHPHLETLEPDQGSSRVLGEVLQRGQERAAAVAAVADGEESSPIGHTPDVVVDLYATRHGNQSVLDAFVEVGNRLLRRHVTGYPRIHVLDPFSEEGTRLVDGMFRTLARITTGTSLDDRVVGRATDEFLHNLDRQKGAVWPVDVGIQG